MSKTLQEGRKEASELVENEKKNLNNLNFLLLLQEDQFVISR